MAYIRKIWKYLPKKRNEMLLRATRKIDMRLPYEAISSCCQNDGHTVCSFVRPRQYSVFAFNGISTESLFITNIPPKNCKSVFHLRIVVFISLRSATRERQIFAFLFTKIHFVLSTPFIFCIP